MLQYVQIFEQLDILNVPADLLLSLILIGVILASQHAKIWALERKVFQAIMMRTGIERQRERMEFLTRYHFGIYT